jgi:hypothetical protein
VSESERDPSFSLTLDPRKIQMKNAHLRFGWLTYVKSTEKTTTSIRPHLDRFVGEMLPDPPRQAKAQMISVVGGDTQISAVSAASSMADRFLVEGPDLAPTRVCLERNAQCFKGSFPLTGRKKPLRHLIAISVCGGRNVFPVASDPNPGRLVGVRTRILCSCRAAGQF